jgi:hypothetical protein
VKLEKMKQNHLEMGKMVISPTTTGISPIRMMVL